MEAEVVVVNDSDLGDKETTSLAIAPRKVHPTCSAVLVPLKQNYRHWTNLPEKSLLGIATGYKLSRIHTKVLLHSMMDYVRVVSLLQDAEAEFLTHDIPGEKPFKAVI